MKKYTLAFIFDNAMDRVLLVHKLSPEWQAGKLNGVGGKIEEGENSLACIVREVREETGLVTRGDEWIYLGEMGSGSWQMHVFTFVYKGKPSDARSADKEDVEWFDMKTLPLNTISNLTWLIPIAIDRIKNKEIGDFSVRYR